MCDCHGPQFRSRVRRVQLLRLDVIKSSLQAQACAADELVTLLLLLLLMVVMVVVVVVVLCVIAMDLNSNHVFAVSSFSTLDGSGTVLSRRSVGGYSAVVVDGGGGGRCRGGGGVDVCACALARARARVCMCVCLCESVCVCVCVCVC